MKRVPLLILLISLMLFSSLCINGSPSKSSAQGFSHTQSSSPKDITAFLTSAKERLEKCGTGSKGILAPGEGLKYLNMSVLNSTTAEVGGKEYRYVVVGIGNVSFSGKVRIGEYTIIWGRPRNITTTGGQRVDFKVYKDGTPVGSLTYWYVPVQMDSYCLAIASKLVTLTDNNTLIFVFIRNGTKNLWLVLE
ncbi:hypothetical protein [Thermococcus sp. 21S7]|uniref:hypothetical protein n=1 Tax=Thermococcus sp. 21S7 TaxID=1638221 RepID=UPI00143B14AF|nr:hypothetical protein [Thermococcus sp. 21S7]NJE61268.1 hypothetical protein [Thermococcus sp. 21S7]